MKKILLTVFLVGFAYFYYRKSHQSISDVQESIKKKPKNVVLIIADDVGYNDVSFHGSNEFATHNIDALAYNGIIMERLYAAPLCTPSRASLMTGKYHHRIGMQHHVIWHDSPYGLGLNYKIMPQYFKDAGYSTHLVGKWHLGHFQPQYWPQRRGFDSFFGYVGAYVDYYDQSVQMHGKNYSRGHDLRRNFEDVKEYKGQYASDILSKETIKVIENHDKEKPLFLVVAPLAVHSAEETNPLQPKKEDMKRFTYIKNEERRKLAAMMYPLDQSVGDIVSALTEKGLMEDTIIAFMSDNGGPTEMEEIHATTASNYPLRGEKGFAWEGGIRVPGIIYAPFLPSGVSRKQIFQVSDFLPTLATLASADYEIKNKIDGIDLSKMITEEEGPFRHEVETIEEIYGLSSLILDGYKLINGTALQGRGDGWLGTNDNPTFNSEKYFDEVFNSKAGKSLRKFNSPLKLEEITKIRNQVRVKCLGVKSHCDPAKAACLFDIENDPCEENNLAVTHKTLFNKMKNELDERVKLVVASKYVDSDPRADPAFHDNTWNWWQHDDEDQLIVEKEL